MGDSNDTSRNVLQFGLFLGLLLVGLLPFLIMVWRSGSFRARMASLLGCGGLRQCCTRRVHYDASDLRTLQELEEPDRPSAGINGAYRRYQLRRSRLSLRLASWREDVKKCGQQDDLHHKLTQIQAAQFSHQPAVASYSYPAAAPSAANANARARTTDVPFDIQIVSVNDRVEGSVARSSSSVSSASTIDGEAVYALVPPTPTSGASVQRSAALTEDEEEEKEDSRV